MYVSDASSSEGASLPELQLRECITNTEIYDGSLPISSSSTCEPIRKKKSMSENCISEIRDYLLETFWNFQDFSDSIRVCTVV